MIACEEKTPPSLPLHSPQQRQAPLSRALNREVADCTATPAGGAEVLPAVRQKAELQDVERQLATDPGALSLHLRRARLLSQLYRLADAKDEYLKVLESDPNHLGALNNLGNVLFLMGQCQEARNAYREAILRHPDAPNSRVNLANLLLQESELMEARGQGQEALHAKHEARQHYEHALRLKPGYQPAHQGLSFLLGSLGEQRQAAWHRREAFGNRYIVAFPYRGERPPIPVLLLSSTSGGNVSLHKFLDDRIFQTHIVLPEFYDRHKPLPPHELVVNAIGDTEIASGALAAAQSFLTLTSAPVINLPSAVFATGRSDNAKRLSSLPGVAAPITVTLARDQLTGANASVTLAGCGLEFPVLLRVPGFHTGMKFLRVDNFEALPAALAELPGRELIVMQYLDARGPDGKARKYRVMMIDGQIYPLHLAISNHWKVHYFTAEMAASPDHRAEEAAFLQDMPAVLGPQAMHALEQIQSTLGLDYGGIDFVLNAQGEVLVFEANATMVVNRPEAGEQWSYRLPAYHRIEAAIQKMFRRRIRQDEAQRAGPQSHDLATVGVPLAHQMPAV
jgi:tetratricopeptide (TPR) repeat protein